MPLGAIQTPDVFAGFLGLIHRGVGIGDQAFHGGGMIGVHRDAATTRHTQGLALEFGAQLADGARDAVGHHFQYLIRHVGRQYGKLIAAQPRENLVAPRLAADLGCHAYQRGVARAVAISVINVFETIEIKKEQRELAATALRIGAHALDFFIEAITVVDPR